MAVLLYCEHNNAELNAATGKALTAAVALGGEIHALVAGHNCGAVAEEASRLTGVGKVILVDAPALEDQIAEEIAGVIVR